MNFYPDLEQFKSLSKTHNLIPVHSEFLGIAKLRSLRTQRSEITGLHSCLNRLPGGKYGSLLVFGI
jgi:hypothetical protein